MTEVRDEIVEQVAEIIDPSAWMVLCIPHTELDVTRQKYLQSRALYKAVEILRLAAKTPDLSAKLIEHEKAGWRKLGVPIDEPLLAAIVESKYA